MPAEHLELLLAEWADYRFGLWTRTNLWIPNPPGSGRGGNKAQLDILSLKAVPLKAISSSPTRVAGPSKVPQVIHIECGWGAEGPSYFHKKLRQLASLTLPEYSLLTGFLPRHVHVYFVYTALPSTFARARTSYRGPGLPKWMSLHYIRVHRVLNSIKSSLAMLPPPNERSLPDRFPLLRAIHFQAKM